MRLRDYDAEIKAKYDAIDKLKKKKHDAEVRMYVGVGKIAVSVFGNDLLSMTNADLTKFFSDIAENNSFSKISLANKAKTEYNVKSVDTDKTKEKSDNISTKVINDDAAKAES